MSFERESYLLKSAAYAAIIVAAVLIVGKYFAWRLTDSVSIQASLLDSVLDIFASIVNFFAVRQALKPADFHHRFGYGKIEALAGIAQSIFILVSAIWLLGEVYNHMVMPHEMGDISMATNVMGVSTILTILLVAYQRYVISRTKSVAIEADSLHYQTDLLTNAGVLIGINISAYFGLNWLDPIIGIFIIVYIVITSYKISKTSLDILVDRELPEKQRLQILDIVRQHPKVYGVHDLKTRSAGLYEFIQMHLDLDENITLKEAHDIAEKVELSLLHYYPKAEVIIHQDPAKITENGFERPKSNVDSWIKHKEEWFADYAHTNMDDDVENTKK